MKIVLISTFEEFGGAAKACKRLAETLQKHTPYQITLLVGFKKSKDKSVIGYTDSIIRKINIWTRFIVERLYFLFFEKSVSVRYAFSPGKSGLSIHKHSQVREADIVHLHWVNFGMLSIKGIENIIALDTKVVWTLHDMWAFTGGCHYSEECDHFTESCGNCKFLKRPRTSDLSHSVWKHKKQRIDFSRIHLVTCSSWLRKEALKSKLLANANIRVVPNSIDTACFHPLDKATLRKKYDLGVSSKYLLFGAFNLSDPRKGFHLLKKSLDKLSAINTKLLLFGNTGSEELNDIAIPFHYLGKINSTEIMNEIYNLSDIFLLPSLFDNLPNTIMEAMSAGIPCIAFDSGGVTDMIDHNKNGLLIPSYDTDAFSEGIDYILNNTNYADMAFQAREKVLNNFTEEHIVKKYLEIYKK